MKNVPASALSQCGMDPARFAQSMERPCRPLSDYDRDTILWMYQDGRPLLDIARAIERHVGTVKTFIRALRNDGLVGRRYA